MMKSHNGCVVWKCCKRLSVFLPTAVFAFYSSDAVKGSCPEAISALVGPVSAPGKDFGKGRTVSASESRDIPWRSQAALHLHSVSCSWSSVGAILFVVCCLWLGFMHYLVCVFVEMLHKPVVRFERNTLVLHLVPPHCCTINLQHS